MYLKMCVEVRKKLVELVVFFRMGCLTWIFTPWALGSPWIFGSEPSLLVSGLLTEELTPLYSVCIGRPVLAFCWFCVFGVFCIIVCFTAVLWWLTLSCSSVPMLSFSLIWRILPRVFCRVGLLRNSFSLLLFCLFYFVESLSFSLK